MTRLPRIFRMLVILVVAALLLLGLLIQSSWAAIFLVIVATVVLWLTALTWQAVPAPARALRVLVLGVIVVAAIWRAAGHN